MRHGEVLTVFPQPGGQARRLATLLEAFCPPAASAVSSTGPSRTLLSPRPQPPPHPKRLPVDAFKFFTVRGASVSFPGAEAHTQRFSDCACAARSLVTRAILARVHHQTWTGEDDAVV